MSDAKLSLRSLSLLAAGLLVAWLLLSSDS